MAGKFKYAQTREKLLGLIGAMQPGSVLPNRTVLAAECGVSRVTLERAISELLAQGQLVSRNGSGTYVPKAGKDAQKAAPAARSRDGKTWALMVSNLSSRIDSGVVSGVESFASRHDINLMLYNMDNLAKKQDDFLTRIQNNNVSGIIIIPVIEFFANLNLIGQLLDDHVSIVACSRPIPGYDLPGVFLNHFHSGFCATNHLIAKGCRHIAYISTPWYTTVHNRLDGYMTALAAAGIVETALPLYLPEHNLTAESKSVLRDFFSQHPDVDGIFLFKDRFAPDIYEVLEQMNRSVGDDIRIVSCDNSDICKALSVPLSSMRFPSEELGKTAAEYLLRLTGGESPTALPRRSMLPELVVRRSSGA